MTIRTILDIRAGPKSSCIIVHLWGVNVDPGRMILVRMNNCYMQQLSGKVIIKSNPY